MAKANSTPVRKLGYVKPRCKKGDLAILLEGPYLGYIVDVVEFCGTKKMTDGTVVVNAWIIRHPSFPPTSISISHAHDKNLLPIRPGDLDETETDEISLVHGRSA